MIRDLSLDGSFTFDRDFSDCGFAVYPRQLVLDFGQFDVSLLPTVRSVSPPQRSVFTGTSHPSSSSQF